MLKTNQEIVPSALIQICALNWDLKELVLISCMDNIVYYSRKQNAYLRLSKASKESNQYLLTEIAWIEHLYDQGIKVPKVLKDNKNQTINFLFEQEQSYHAVLFSSLEGNNPPLQTMLSPNFLKNLGFQIAKMHQANLSFNDSGQKIIRKNWQDEKGLEMALKGTQCSFQTDLKDRLFKLIDWMKNLPQCDKNFGIIHGDIGSLNLMVDHQNNIGFIDFASSCYHWFCFDIAMVVYSIARRFDINPTKKQEASWINALLDGYRIISSFDKQEETSLYKFIDYAYLRFYFWIEYMQSTSHEYSHYNEVKSWILNKLACD